MLRKDISGLEMDSVRKLEKFDLCAVLFLHGYEY